MSDLLQTLSLVPTAESLDFVQHKRQFQLHTLLTEQRHARTMDLGSIAQRDSGAALQSLLSVDDDVTRRLAELAASATDLLRATQAVVDAVRHGRRVYVYGCGATGRLAKQLESAFWRPFWRRMLTGDHAAAVRTALPQVESAVVGEMTGGDRALVSSLEGFEDLLLMGSLQLEDHGIEQQDVVICVTEGGETSSVIGTMLAAAQQGGDRDQLFFFYNNPDDVLLPFERSRRILEHAAVTRVNLTTGSQAIAGSTRMQATTIGTFVLGIVLEQACAELLRGVLPDAVRAELFGDERGLENRLRDFAALPPSVARTVPALAQLTNAEAECYARGGCATYFAQAALVTVFTDCTERSPTFRLQPLDPVDAAPARSWVRVVTTADNAPDAWQALLGRPFRGLALDRYGPPLRAEVQDPFLVRAALRSLDQAGTDQAARYDFAASADNLARRAAAPHDLLVAILLDGETIGTQLHSARQRSNNSALIQVSVGSRRPPQPDWPMQVDLRLDTGADPLTVRQQIALKMLLNAHSSATMARLGRVVGNTMTNVAPTNLKLVGRATYLIHSHTNEVLRARGLPNEVTYAEANAVLFDAMTWTREQQAAATTPQSAEVALCIVRILETLLGPAPCSFESAAQRLQQHSLAALLAGYRG